MPDFASLLDKFQWREMRNCPGRYILAETGSRLQPSDILTGAPVREYRVKTARDPVLVMAFDGGGIISYRKPGGSYLHTLNTNEGFERKLAQLGISLSD